MPKTYKKSDFQYIKFGQHEELILQYFESGSTKRSIPYYKGQVHGVIVEWYNSGTIRSEMSVLSGKVHGINRNYSGLGRLELELKFTDGEVSDRYNIYTRQGGFFEDVISENSVLSNINRAYSKELLKYKDLRSKLSKSNQIVIMFCM